MTTPAQPTGSVSADEVLSLAELQKRYGWGEHATRQARKRGLRVIVFGNRKYCLGRDVLAFFDGLGDGREVNITE